MKFSEIEKERWPELKPYLDTALVPLSGLSGRETPWEATIALERLRDALEPLESAYKGRVVTYPAVHYAENDEALAEWVDEFCRRLFSTGFKYCIVVAGDSRLLALPIKHASLLIGPESGKHSSGEYRARAKKAVEALWFGAKPPGAGAT